MAVRGSEFFKKGGAWGLPFFCLACPSWRRRGSFPPSPGERAALAAQGGEFFKKGGARGLPFLPGLPQLEEAEELSATARGEGGFGSTGQ